MTDLLTDVRQHLAGVQHTPVHRQNNLPAVREPVIRTPTELRPLSTKWRVILSMEMRGLTKREIAEQLRMSYGSVINITTSVRYVEHREHALGIADQEFINLKPAAIKALAKGLCSDDQNVALRASDQWFSVAGYGARRGGPSNNPTLTAEAVVARIFENATINVQNTHIHPDRVDVNDPTRSDDTGRHIIDRTSGDTTAASSTEQA